MTVNFKDIGGGLGGDDYPILMSAIAGGAHSIYFPEGIYTFSQCVELKRCVRLYGDGMGGWSDPAVLNFPNSGAFVVNRKNTLNGGTESPATTAADWSIIEGLCLRGKAGSDRHGIRLRARALIRNCLISGFGGNGVHIVATAGSSAEREGNANNWRIEGGRIENSGGSGIYIDGADVNAGVAYGVDVSSNAGWGIFDSSFLGNTYVGCHAATNALGSYKTDDPNARCIFVGCYAENDNAASVPSPSLILGGLFNANAGSAQRIGDGRQTAFNIPTPAGQSTAVIAQTASYGWDGRPLTMVAAGDHSHGWSWQWEDTSGCWRLVHASLNSRSPIYLTTNLTAARGKAKDSAGVPLPGGKIIMTEIMVKQSDGSYAPLNLLNVYTKTL